MKETYYVALLTEEDAQDYAIQICEYVLHKYHHTIQLYVRQYDDGWRVIPYYIDDIRTMREAVEFM